MSTKNEWKIKPTSSALSWRYSRSSSVTVGHRTITPTLFSSMDSPYPTYLPQSWGVSTNPEGNLYFTRATSPRIVTDANLYDSDILQQILQVVDVVEEKLAAFKSTNSETTEIFLELEDDETCSYYLIDHTLRVQFWLEEVSTDDLGMRASASAEHLRLDLERLYWMHVEYFPAHECRGLNLAVDELTDIMIHGHTDQMTSTTSTFPYSADECARFIKSLETLKGSAHCPSTYSKWSIARMWQNVVDQRFLIHYGQEHARVASNISILDINVSSQTLLFKICDTLGFKAPQTYLRSLNEQWVDEIAHSNRWKSFISACEVDWKMSLLVSFAILISPIASSKIVAVPAILLCNAAAAAAIVLLIQHGPLAGRNHASDVSWYLSNADSRRFGLQLTAITFSLPRALTLWALIISSMQVPVVVLGLKLAAICIGGAAAFLVVLSASVKIAGPISFWFRGLWSGLRGYFHRAPPEQSSV
ncbi:hypothetical protein BC835DRAFT_1410454 [Cytidiella melzeri]|nr:hypothetical protein BC835DRAFT_1410454 [Cytidiella melzeri]